MKHLAPILTSSLLLFLSAGSPVSAAPRGGVPLRWTVETSRAQPATFDEFAGATYDLEATLQSYGKPLEVVGEPHLYWQTNGMGSAYWTATATVSGNVLRATWTPACDVGARAYNCFIGITGTVYNAAFHLRLRPSPGAVPNVIDQPPRVLDLEHTIVINPPWPTNATISERIREVIDEDGITAPVETNVVTSIITNTVTKQFVEDLGISGGGSSGVDTNAVRDIALWPATNYTDRATGEVIRSVGALADEVSRSVGALADTKRDKTDLAVHATITNVAPFGIDHWFVNDNRLSLAYSEDGFAAWSGFGLAITATQSDGTLKFNYGDPGDSSIDFNFLEGDLVVYYEPIDTYITNHVKAVMKRIDTIALVSQLQPPPVTSVNSQTGAVTLSAADVGAYPNASGQTLAAQVSTIGGHLNAEDARFVSTNYNSSTHMPEAYVEVKLPDGTWSVVWREMTRWNWLADTYLPLNYARKSDLDEKADRAWGYYDSHSGNYAPDGYTWISSPKLAIAGGLAWQRTVTSEGAIWVLESNGLVTESGGTTNGFFRISDDEGNAMFEIVKGGKRTIGADSSGMHVLDGFSPTRMMIEYSIVSDVHPTIQVCDSLTTQNWKTEDDPDCLANVTWEGTSGAYVAYVQGKTAQSQLFVTATYEAGGESYIRNAAPVSLSHLYINGTKYAVGTASISGHTVLTLTPAP